jgi:hypothetical protein
MPIDDSGFLGAHMQQVQEQIRSKHHELFDLSIALNKCAQRIKFQLEVPDTNRKRKAAACFFIRVLNGVQSAILLHENGLTSEAAVIIRSVYEAFIYLKSTRDRSDFIEDLLQDNDARRLKDLNYLLNCKYADLSSEEIIDVEAEIAEIKSRGITGTEKLIIQNLDPENYSLFRLFSQETHPGLTTVSKYLQDDADGQNYIEWGPSERDIEINMVSACAMLCDSIFVVLDIFEVAVPSDLTSIHAKISANYDRINEDNKT